MQILWHYLWIICCFICYSLVNEKKKECRHEFARVNLQYQPITTKYKKQKKGKMLYIRVHSLKRTKLVVQILNEEIPIGVFISTVLWNFLILIYLHCLILRMHLENDKSEWNQVRKIIQSAGCTHWSFDDITLVFYIQKFSDKPTDR